MAKVGDKYILHSANGKDYNIEIINVSYYRPPDMKYAIDIIDENGYSGDWIFCDDDFLINTCEKIGEKMETVEDIRKIIIEALTDKPILGKNYIDWHTENPGECGVTIIKQNQEFDIIIRNKNQNRRKE